MSAEDLWDRLLNTQYPSSMANPPSEGYDPHEQKLEGEAGPQAQILHLMADLKKELDLATFFITHDLEVARRVSDRVGGDVRWTDLGDWRG